MPRNARTAQPVQRDNGIFYLRVTIPRDVRSLYLSASGRQREQIWVSLQTNAPELAKKRANLERVKFDREFAAKRWELRPRVGLTQDDLHEAALGTYRRLDAADEDLRLNPPSEADLDAVWRVLQREHPDDELTAWRIFQGVREALADPAAARRQRSAAIKAEAGRFGDTTVKEDVADFVRERHLDASPGDAAWRKIANAIQRGEQEANKRAEERDEGDFSGEARDPLVSAPATPRAKPGEGIMDRFEAYARENPRGITADTLNMNRMAVALFVSTLPPRSTVKAITRGACAEWKRLLMLYPVKAAETKVFRGKSMREIVELNETVGKPTITPRTVNRYLASLGAFCDWLLAHDDIQASPLSRMQLTIKKGTGKPFPLDALPKIFASPLFTGAESEAKMRRAGNHMIRDHRFWIPLVMLYSGARPGELAQLLVEDVREAHGRWIMHITTENDEDKTLKTESSPRVVPIHPELERLGFLAYVDSLRAKGERRVFPQAKRNDRQWVPDLSREFSRLLSDIGVKTDAGPSSKLSLYSFRHTVSDALRRAGFDDAEFAPLYGHGKATTTGRYGNEKPRTIEQRARMIDAIAFEGLDVSALYPCSLTTPSRM
ncbi:site-specific integrase [Hansschlegelia sp.]|uniref:site-specific integrase n=1 Tax=Hansschlegelia sp. TaxID=2041892 RepID=UPI002D1C983F|nr:site-specific integrase [Hansschlegelia sp.]HVI28093.1 site-specific integrase [Hansschlegelia sp.]